MPVFSSIVAILFSLNCQKQDYNRLSLFVNHFFTFFLVFHFWMKPQYVFASMPLSGTVSPSLEIIP